jgi:hypothetical protein
VNRRAIEPYLLARCLIRAAAWIVPSRSRADWQREWMAELHYARRTLREEGRELGLGSRLIGFALGAFQDAAWHRTHTWSGEHIERTVARGTESASFCLFAIGMILAVITVTSGFLPRTRAALLRLPYTDPDRIATVAQGDTTLAVRSGIRDEWVRWWRTDSHLIEGAATYFWSDKTVDRRSTRVATVSPDFFSLLGARTAEKRRFASNSFENCSDCVVLSYDFWRKAYDGKAPASILVDGTRFRVIAVLNKEFWFLTRRIGVWEIRLDTVNHNAKTGVVIRLRPDVTDAQARAELVSIVQAQGVNPWSSLIVISSLSTRVRAVFWSFALALVLAIGTILPAVRVNFAPRSTGGAVRALFFCSKTGLLLVAVLLAGLEFTRAPSITMLGGTDLATEPFSTWLFLLGCMGTLTWSIYDQRHRCRVCLRRFGLAAQVGCRGCVFLSWAGTEMVCLEGHGMLRVPERVSSWQRPDQWMSLDDSLVELFTQDR